MTTTETAAWWRDLPSDVIQDSPMLYVDGVLVNVVEALAARAEASTREVARLRAAIAWCIETVKPWESDDDGTSEYRLGVRTADRLQRTLDGTYPPEYVIAQRRVASPTTNTPVVERSRTEAGTSSDDSEAREVQRLREALTAIAALCQAFPIGPGMPSECFDPDAIADIALAVLAVKEES